MFTRLNESPPLDRADVNWVLKRVLNTAIASSALGALWSNTVLETNKS